MSNEKIGLVLAGGGGKGAYEIGVFKYLHEVGLDSKFSVISGTSVGGLNAVLFALGDYELAEKIWLTEIDDKILDFESSSYREGALFSRNGLVQIMDKYIDLKQLKKSGKNVFVTCLNTKTLEAEYINLNDHWESRIRRYLLATSAIPLIFQNEKIRKGEYVDGGFADNVPLKPLLGEGCSRALVVILNNNYHVDFSGYDIKTQKIYPSRDLGGFDGTLDFTPQTAMSLIQLGYDDCKKIYSLQIKELLERESQEDSEMTEVDTMERIAQINAMGDGAVFLETLKEFVADPSLVNSVYTNWNLEWKTDKDPFWKKEPLAEFNGWKWQKHSLFDMARLLDNNGVQRAWGLYQKIAHQCRQFLADQARRRAAYSKADE